MSFNPQAKSDANFELPEEGLYPARLARIVELGKQADKWGEKNKVVLGFTVPSLTINIDGEEKQRLMWTSKFGLNQTSNPDSTLMKYIKAIDGTVDHMKKLLGKPCMIELAHSAPNKDGNVYCNISSVTKPMKGLDIPEPDCSVYMFEFSNPDKDVWDQLSESRQEDIKKAVNAGEMLSKLENKAAAEASKDNSTDPEYDDDIPF